MRLLRPATAGGWLLTGSGPWLLWPSRITLLIAVLQMLVVVVVVVVVAVVRAIVLLVTVGVPAWRQAHAQSSALRMLQEVDEPPASMEIGADGQIKIRWRRPRGRRYRRR